MGAQVWSRFSLVLGKWSASRYHDRTGEVSLLLRYEFHKGRALSAKPEVKLHRSYRGDIPPLRVPIWPRHRMSVYTAPFPRYNTTSGLRETGSNVIRGRPYGHVAVAKTTLLHLEVPAAIFTKPEVEIWRSRRLRKRPWAVSIQPECDILHNGPVFRRYKTTSGFR